MSHGDEVTKLPKGFNKLATTKENNIAAIGNMKKRFLAYSFILRLHTLQKAS